jgi:hypothetical protein
MAANYTSNQTNDCSPLFSSDTKCDIILGFRRAVGVVSVLCCVFIISVIILFKKYRFFTQRLILYLSASALFQAIGYIMGDYHIAKAGGRISEGVCIFQGYWDLFFDWVSLLWVCCITFNIFLIAVFSRRGEKFEKLYFIVVIVVSLLISAHPFIMQTYGPAGLWCWIKSSENGRPYTPGIAMQFSLFYVPFWVTCLVLLAMLAVAYTFVRKNRHRYEGQYVRSNEIQMKLWQEEIRPLMLFPLIYIAILIFPSMNRLRYAFGYEAQDSPANFFFWFMHSVTLTLRGTIYALVFGCDRQTLSRLKWIEIKGAVMHWRANSRVQEYPAEKVAGEDTTHQHWRTEYVMADELQDFK